MAWGSDLSFHSSGTTSGPIENDFMPHNDHSIIDETSRGWDPASLYPADCQKVETAQPYGTAQASRLQAR